jgi:hypothetical protein
MTCCGTIVSTSRLGASLERGLAGKFRPEPEWGAAKVALGILGGPAGLAGLGAVPVARAVGAREATQKVGCC